MAGDGAGARPGTILPRVPIGAYDMVGPSWTLAAAGLLMVDGWNEPERLIPRLIAGQARSCQPEEGRVEAVLDIGDPLLHEKANADSYRLSVD
ncbi:hypothetical protein [Streptomyces sp. NPDC054797]